jgi:hypothetical protein
VLCIPEKTNRRILVSGPVRSPILPSEPYSRSRKGSNPWPASHIILNIYTLTILQCRLVAVG